MFHCIKIREISSKGVGARGHKAETQNCALRAQFWPLGVITYIARVSYQGASTLQVLGLYDLPCAAYPNVSPAQLWLIPLTTLAPPLPCGRRTRRINPRPYSVFCHLRPCRGGGGGVGATPPPWRSAPDGRRASRKKPVDAPRRDLAIAHIVFGPRLMFDLVRSGQRSNFREKWHFLLYTLIAA